MGCGIGCLLVSKTVLDVSIVAFGGASAVVQGVTAVNVYRVLPGVSPCGRMRLLRRGVTPGAEGDWKHRVPERMECSTEPVVSVGNECVGDAKRMTRFQSRNLKALQTC